MLEKRGRSHSTLTAIVFLYLALSQVCGRFDCDASASLRGVDTFLPPLFSGTKLIRASSRVNFSCLSAVRGKKLWAWPAFGEITVGSNVWELIPYLIREYWHSS